MFGANEEIGDTLEPEKGIENGPKSKIKLYIIIGVIAVVVIVIVITIVVVTTKGDNNNTKDTNKKTKNDIIGLVKLRIPLLGYPSVFVSELLK